MKKPVIWAHRGASGYEPENTLASFAKAVELGADGIELDIQLTKDGQLVVLHDELINRTSTGTGLVNDYTLSELRSFDFSFPKKFPGHKKLPIPTMEEVFALIRPTNLIINIELKTGILFYPGIEQKILDMTRAFGMEDRVIYSSFNHYTIRSIRQMNPEAKTALLFQDGFIDVPEYAKQMGVDALHPEIYIIRYPGFMGKCAQLGLDVNTWTVNKEEYMRLCCEYGVNAIITNYPDRARKVVNEYFPVFQNV